MKNIKFYKYHGTGNDFILIDDRELIFDLEDSGLIAKMCRRRFGIGADGLILLRDHDKLDFEMIYFNSDGRQSSMCGNGGRCFGKFVVQLGLANDQVSFMAIDGEHYAKITPSGIELVMTAPQEYRKINETEYWIDSGSPHYVRFIDHSPEEVDLVPLAKTIRYSNEFKEEGTNFNLVWKKSPEEMVVRTYERGVEDETLSCGTGVVAVAEIHRRIMGWESAETRLTTPGGELTVLTDARKMPILRGPAQFVFSGNWKENP